MTAMAQVFRDAAKSEREAWAWLVVNAAEKTAVVATRRGETEVKRGQLAVSVRSLADRWGWDRMQVQRYLGRLEGAGMVSRSVGPLGQVLTIKGYDALRPKPAPAPKERAAAVTQPPRHIVRREVKLNSIVTSTEGFLRWLSTSTMGDWCVYHVGHIGLDRTEDPDLNERAALVLVLADLDFVNSSIARPPFADQEIFAYVATRTGRGYAPRSLIAGDITAHLYLALRAVQHRAADLSAARAIRDGLAVSEAVAARFLADLAARGLVERTGYKDSWVMTEKGRRAVV